MTTRVLSDNKNDIQAAASIIKRGGLVALPTETVYGLGANALDSKALKKIFAAKNRPMDNPLIVHLADTADLPKVVASIPPKAQMLVNAFMPGALTIILSSNGIVPSEATGGLDSVAVRIPSNNTMRDIIRASGVPIAAPSANSSGKPSPTLASHVIEDLSGKIDAVVDGGPALFGLESTVIDMTGEPCLLRPGMITKEMIEAVIGAVSTINYSIGSEPPKSPGMKYRHYAPKAPVFLFHPTLDAMNIINQKSGVKTGIFVSKQNSVHFQNGEVIISGDLDDPKTIAASLFRALREFDFLGVDEIYAEIISEAGEGAAIMNRLRKAAAK